MNMLASVETQMAVMGTRVVIAAQEKVGKTTTACGAPKPLLIPLEQGYAGVTVPHLPYMITDYMQFVQLQNEILEKARARQLPYQTLIFDSATALERLIHSYTIACDPKSKTDKSLSMETAHGGYGKAYGVANQHFNNFLTWCDQLVIHGKVNIVLTAHVFSSKVKDPLTGEYDSWDLQLHSPKDQKTYGKREILRQWADVIGYVHEPMTTTTTGTVTRAVQLGQGRVMGVELTPSYVAGNRYGMKGTIALPAPPYNAWNALANALTQSGSKVDIWNREWQ